MSHCGRYYTDHKLSSFGISWGFHGDFMGIFSLRESSMVLDLNQPQGQGRFWNLAARVDGW
jgi:hypothetical protein